MDFGWGSRKVFPVDVLEAKLDVTRDPTNEKRVKGTPERVEPQLSNPKMTAKFN